MGGRGSDTRGEQQDWPGTCSLLITKREGPIGAVALAIAADAIKIRGLELPPKLSELLQPEGQVEGLHPWGWGALSLCLCKPEDLIKLYSLM